MSNNSSLKFISWAIVLLTIIQCQQWFTTYIISWYVWNLSIVVLSIPFIIFWNKSNKPAFRDFWPLYLYLLWITVISIFSLKYARSTEYLSEIIRNCSGTILIGSIIYLAEPVVMKDIFSKWKKYTLPLSTVVIFLFSILDGYSFYICLLQIYLILSRILNKRTYIIVIGITLFLLYVCWTGDNRSGVIKYGVALLIGFIPTYKLIVKQWMLKAARIVCFIVPLVLIYLATFGDYNVLSANEEAHSAEEFYTDTRTGVYTEAIVSAVENDYVLSGRTPARGYDSLFQENRSGRLERSSEVSIVNIFTWYGLLGVILYTIFFWWITGKGLFESKNIYIKCIALYLCFRYTFAWIEDFNRLDPVNITLWIMMSLCLLPQYREMSDEDFECNMKYLNF